VTGLAAPPPETEEQTMAESHATTSDPRDEGSGPEVTSVVHRRTMLKGFAIAGAAVPVLVACGSDNKSSDSGSDPTSPPSSSSGGGSTTSSGGGTGGDVLVKASEVKVGSGVILPDQHIVVTQPTAGTFKGFSSTCTHMGCTVSSISDGTINCPCHGSMYSIKDGSVTGGPAPAPLPPKPVKDEGGNIVLT
jgi:Rieske Fe-S protein